MATARGIIAAVSVFAFSVTRLGVSGEKDLPYFASYGGLDGSRDTPAEVVVFHIPADDTQAAVKVRGT